MSDISIYKWSKSLKHGQQHAEIELHPRRSKISTTEEMMADRINTLIQNNPRIAVWDTASTLNTSLVVQIVVS